MGYFELFASNKRLLTFGILLTFFSGFGKTFLLSLFIPYILVEFSLSNTSFASIYAVATILSGVMIIYLGGMIDKMKVRNYAILVTLGLIASCMMLSLSYNVWLLGIALFGLRISGQGLMNHTSLTVITKNFKKCRGKAISLALLGHPLGEALLPVSVVIAINMLGWREAALFFADIMAILLIPAIFHLLRNKQRVRERASLQTIKAKPVKETWTIRKILNDRRFYLLAPGIIAMSMVITGLMFYFVPFATQKGWSIEWVAFCFTGFAAGNVLSTFITGSLIDRYKAISLFPFYLLPMAAGIFILISFQHPNAAYIFLMLTGISLGMGVTIESSIFAEIYGIKSIGRVRSLFSSIAIASTAMGPLAPGILIDHGIRLESVLAGGAVLLLAASLVSLKLLPFRNELLKEIRMPLTQKSQ